MAKIETKSWRTDYPKLLKCWSMMKTSDMLREMATKDLQSLNAEERAHKHLRKFIQTIDSKPFFDQTTALWKKTSQHFLKQNDFLAAAESLQSLSEIQLAYGSVNDDKKEPINNLMDASKNFRKGSNTKGAIIAAKRALTIAEFRTDRDLRTIAQRYEECGTLYRSLDLGYLAKLNQQISDFYQTITPSLPKCRKRSKSLIIDGIDSTQSARRQSTSSGYSLRSSSIASNSGFDGIQQNEEQIDSKELVRKQIREMTANNTTRSAQIDNESDYPESLSDEDVSPHVVRKRVKYNNRSQKLLRKNLKTIFANRLKDSEDSENSSQIDSETDNESHSKSVSSVNLTVDTQQRLTTQITVAAPSTPTPSPAPQIDVNNEIKPKRKRKLKPKEESEESPQKRISKLNREGIIHHFSADEKNPSERLFCRLCRDSVLCYRWSTVTDHLETKKHQNLIGSALLDELVSSSEYQMQCQTTYTTCDDNYNYTKKVDYCEQNHNNGLNLNSVHYTSTQLQGIPFNDNYTNNDKYDNSEFPQMPSTSGQMPSQSFYTLNLDSFQLSSYPMEDNGINEPLFEDINDRTLNTPDPPFNQ